MTPYVLEFEWCDAVTPLDEARRTLEAQDIEEAKLEAALTYAMAEFTGAPPTAYRIIAGDQQEVYRYPGVAT